MTIVIESGATETSGINILSRNVMGNGTLSWGGQLTGYEAVNVIDDATWNSWAFSGVPKVVSVDRGSSVMCNAAGIAAHTAGTNGSGLRIQYSSDDITWNNATSVYSPLTDDTIFWLFPNTTARYWRLQVLNAECNIGVLKIGEKFAFDNSPISGHRPIHHSKTYDMLSNKSQTGHLLNNRVIRRGASTSIDMGLMDRTFVEGSMLSFEEHYNTGRSFFYCGSPLYTPDDMGYCWRPNGGNTMNITWEEGDDLAQVDFEVEAYVQA